MSERLDRIEAILEVIATQQARRTDAVDSLVDAASANETAIRELTANTKRTAARVKSVLTLTLGKTLSCGVRRATARRLQVFSPVRGGPTLFAGLFPSGIHGGHEGRCH